MRSLLPTATVRDTVRRKLHALYPDAVTLHLTVAPAQQIWGVETQKVTVAAATLYGSDITPVDPEAEHKALTAITRAYPSLDLTYSRDYTIATGMFTTP